MVALSHARVEDAAVRLRYELHSDPRIAVQSLGVEVEDGEATLTGSVRNFASKLFANDAAQRVRDVREVRNLINVTIPANEFRADIEIAEAVRYGFRWNSLLADTNVNCVVVDGWVLVTGNVSAEYKKAEAAAIISHMMGVRGIVNDIVVAA